MKSYPSNNKLKPGYTTRKESMAQLSCIGSSWLLTIRHRTWELRRAHLLSPQCTWNHHPVTNGKIGLTVLVRIFSEGIRRFDHHVKNRSFWPPFIFGKQYNWTISEFFVFPGSTCASSPPLAFKKSFQDPLMLCVRAGTLEMLHFLYEQKYIDVQDVNRVGQLPLPRIVPDITPAFWPWKVTIYWPWEWGWEKV